jgi:hypothetical protein
MIWFVSAPLPGHTDWGGMLRTARALAGRGQDVLWVSGAPLRGLIEAAGITFAEVAETGWRWPPPPVPDLQAMNPVDAMFLRYRRALDTWLDEALIPPAFEAFTALAAQQGTPDLIVTDPFLSAAAFAAEALDVRLVVAGWPAGAPLDESHLHSVQADLSRISLERMARFKRAIFRKAPRPPCKATGCTSRISVPAGMRASRRSCRRRSLWAAHPKPRRRLRRAGWPTSRRKHRWP